MILVTAMYVYICGKAVCTNWTSCETILAEILGILHTTHVTICCFTQLCKDKAFSRKVIFNISSIAVGKLLLIGDHRKDWALCMMTAEHMHSSSFA